MKVPPLIINLKNIEKQDKQEKDGKHEKHEKHREHKKHKKHKKHKHKHHHHEHDHSNHHNHNKEHKDKHPTIKILNPPLLEPVGLPEPEHHHVFSYQSAYAPPSPVPYPHVLHPVPTPPSQIEQRENSKKQPGSDVELTHVEPNSESQPPILEDKVTKEPGHDSKQCDDNGQVIGPPTTLEEAPKSAESLQDVEQQMEAGGAKKDEAQSSHEQAVQAEPAVPIEPVDSIRTPEIGAKKAQEPSSQMSFLKLSEDGGVRLNILVPTKQSDESNERILNLEQVCGQLQDGLDVIPTDINEEECREHLQVNPVEYIDPPTFGSYLPIKDSTFANLTKEDSETLLDIYGGNATTSEYAESLQNFASGTNYLMKMVDSLLDLLTDGKHNKEAVPIRQKLEEARREEVKKNKTAVMIEKKAQNGDAPVSLVDESGKTINNTEAQHQEERMDVEEQSASGTVECSLSDSKESDEVQRQLNEIDTLLVDLRKMQEQRLSSSPAPVEPDEVESKLAEEILEKMTKLIKEKAKPSEICDSSSILKALGIPLDVQS